MAVHRGRTAAVKDGFDSNVTWHLVPVISCDDLCDSCEKPEISWRLLTAGSKLQLFCFVETQVSQYVRPSEDLESDVAALRHAAMHQPLEQAPSVCYACCLHLTYSAASRSFVVCPLNFANYKNFAAVCNLWSCFRNAWIKNSRRHQPRKIFRLARLVERFVERLGKPLRTFSLFKFFSGFKCYSLSALLRSQPRPAWSERNGANLRYRLWKGRSILFKNICCFLF